MHTAEYQLPKNRTEWQGREGFLLMADVALHIMSDVRNIEPTQFPDGPITMPYENIDLLAQASPAISSLYYATRKLTRKIPHIEFPTPDIRQEYGITDEDIRLAERFTTFGNGFSDMDFSWKFAAAIATNVVHQFVKREYLGKEELNNFSLTDWANIIGTGWFGKLMHSMAYTKNGVYGQFGANVAHFLPDSLWNHMLFHNYLPTQDVTSPDDIFVIEEKIEPMEQRSYTTAVLSHGTRDALRGLMYEYGPDYTGGCPVARYGAVLPRAMLTANPHVVNLLESGAVTPYDHPTDASKVRLYLEWSPIDVSLVVLAEKLEQYDQLHGTPRITFTSSLDRGTVSHLQLRPVDALRQQLSSQK